MLKKIVKTVTFTLLLIVLIPILLISGVIIKYRIDYGKTLEKGYIERLTYYSQAIKKGKTVNFEQGALDDEVSERISYWRKRSNYDNEKHRLISYAELPSYLVELLIISEDPDFYKRRFGYAGNFIKQIYNSIKGYPLRGRPLECLVNYTLLELPREPVERRILYEVFAMATVESLLTKEEIIELYLNYTYMEVGIWGAENIAHFYFDKSVKELDPAESALLVAGMKSVFFSPLNGSTGSRKYQLELLKKLEESGTLAPGEAERQVELFRQTFDVKSIGKVSRQ